MGTANLKRAEQIAKDYLILQEFGWGFDGFVFPTSRMTAVKVFDNAATYQNELSVYLRLLEHNVVNVLGFAVPRLVNWDDDRRIIEMTSVNPPFIVDFAHANLTSPLTSPMKTSGGQKKQSCLKTPHHFAIAHELFYALQQYGIFYYDIAPRNIDFKGHPRA